MSMLVLEGFPMSADEAVQSRVVRKPIGKEYHPVTSDEEVGGLFSPSAHSSPAQPRASGGEWVETEKFKTGAKRCPNIGRR